MAESEEPNAFQRMIETPAQRSMRKDREAADRMDERARERSIDNPYLDVPFDDLPHSEHSRLLEEKINSPEMQAFLAAEDLRMRNEERAEQGLPPLPTPEETEEEQKNIMDELRNRAVRKATELPTTYAQAPLAADTDS